MESAAEELSYEPILIFGGVAMLGIAILQGMRIWKGGMFGTNFVKAYGLILIATLGTVLIFATVDAASKTGAFTLLGTIAGYLAGSRPTSSGGAGAGGAGANEGLL